MVIFYSYVNVYQRLNGFSIRPANLHDAMQAGRFTNRQSSGHHFRNDRVLGLGLLLKSPFDASKQHLKSEIPALAVWILTKLDKSPFVLGWTTKFKLLIDGFFHWTIHFYRLFHWPSRNQLPPPVAPPCRRATPCTTIRWSLWEPHALVPSRPSSGGTWTRPRRHHQTLFGSIGSHILW